MSKWKKRFAANVRYEDLPTIGPFSIDEEPESLGKGKYRAKIETDEATYMITTFEGTIGDILHAQGNGKCEAYPEEVGDATYIRFRGVA